jgi:tetratricopeptide (TPR) repeat protein
MAQALGHSVGEARDHIRQRYLALCGKRKALDRHAENSYELLQLLPKEAALYLYGVVIAEAILDSAGLAVFFERMGLQPEGARMLRILLVNCGFLDPLSENRPLRPLAAAALTQAAGKAGSDFIDGHFAAYLEKLYADRRLKPSLGLLSRVGERRENEGLLYDCLFGDALSPGGGAPQALERLSADSASVHALWRALRDGEREACERAAAQMDTITGPRATLLRGLAKAELAYASGDAERASKGSREALLAVAKGTPNKLEARAHRMMGLAALAEGKYTEAADYLNNAQELSENAGDSYERFMAAYARAIGEFMTGALVRALSIAEQARASAMRLFRIEGLVATDLLLGRIRLELGDYDEAGRHYEGIAELAYEYGLEEAAARAAIWRGRAMAYAGDYEEAERALSAFRQDAEARVFLGELCILRGDAQAALPWLERASEQRPRPYHPADAIQWTSCYAEIEDRCISFSATDHALEELRKALKLYAQGLATKNPDYATELYALTRNEYSSKASPGAGTYSFFCYLLEEELPEPPVDKQTVLSRAFKALQQRAGKIEERSKRALYMEKNHWNKRLMHAAREHKFI